MDSGSATISATSSAMTNGTPATISSAVMSATSATRAAV
jgi:hypothetical protein